MRFARISTAVAASVLVASATTGTAAASTGSGQITLYAGQRATTTHTESVVDASGQVSTEIYTVTNSISRDLVAEAYLGQSAAGGGATITAGVTGCWYAITRINTSSLKVSQHKWEHEVRWCFVSGRAQNATENIGRNISTGTGWNWRGNTDAWHYNYGTYLDVYRQGRYELCYPFTGCFQNNYPAHAANYGPGWYSTTITRSR